MNEDTNCPLDNSDDLLTGEPIAVPTASESLKKIENLFDDPVKAQEFPQQAIQLIVNAWAINDRIIQITTKPGYSEDVKRVIKEATTDHLVAPLNDIASQLRDIIIYLEKEEETSISITSLKQQIELQEILSLQNYANSPDNKLYETIRNDFGLMIQPTDTELRTMLLLDVLLDIRENRNRNKIVTATNLPPISRLPNSLR